MEQLDRRNVAAVVTQTGCMGYCYAEPTIEVKFRTGPGSFWFVDLKRADQIIEKYIKTENWLMVSFLLIIKLLT